MMMRHALSKATVLLALILLSACSMGQSDIVWYAIEMDGQLLGCNAVFSIPGDSTTGEPTTVRTEGRLVMSLLGQPLDMTLIETRKYDPVTDEAISIVFEIDTGSSQYGASLLFDGDVAHHTTEPDGTTREIPLEKDLIINEDVLMEAIKENLGSKIGATETFQLLNPLLGAINTREYTARGEESIVIDGQEYACLLFTYRDLTLGVSGQLWIERDEGYVVRSASPDGSVVYLSDRSVRTRIRRTNMNSFILAGTETLIEDVLSIEYMKVRIKVRSAGEIITAEKLNFPGQRFEGTVTDNLIEGVFEIEHPRYSGNNAPSFPTVYSDIEELQPYLGSEWMIEADDPVLIEKAEEITAGARDSWEAAVRLSRWVGEEISGSIPGGSARQTFDTGTGECGSHSRLLAAFCRAVGIPARMVTGGAYTPIEGGSFGQHAWNEIWMGEAGWITVDSTFQESDYVDAGHIRIGLLTSFNPVEAEILDYRLSGPDHQRQN